MAQITSKCYYANSYLDLPQGCWMDDVWGAEKHHSLGSKEKPLERCWYLFIKPALPYDSCSLSIFLLPLATIRWGLYWGGLLVGSVRVLITLTENGGILWQISPSLKTSLKKRVVNLEFLPSNKLQGCSARDVSSWVLVMIFFMLLLLWSDIFYHNFLLSFDGWTGVI